MTDSQDDKKTASRRSFLKLAGGAPLAAAATSVGAGQAQAEQPAANPSGLQDTAHVRTYYALARF